MAKVKSKKSKSDQLFEHKAEKLATVLNAALKDSVLYGEGFVKVFPDGTVKHIPYGSLDAKSK